VAQRHFERYLKLWKRDAKAQLLAAQAARRHGDRESADHHLEEYERLQGVTPDSALERALARAEQGDLEGLESPLRARLTAGGPEVLSIQEALAQGYLAMGQSSQALRLLDEIVRRTPGHSQAFAWRAEARASQHQWEAAEQDGRTAMELDPENPAVRRCLALALERLGWPQQAVAEYGWLRQHGQGDADVVIGLARCWQDLAKLDEARQVLEAFLAEARAHDGALVERGRLALREGDAGRAEDCFRQAVTVAPQNEDACRLLALCLETQGKADEATKVEQRLHELQVHAGRRERLAKAIEANPDDPAPRFELGTWLLREGQEEEGLHSLVSVLDINPRHEGARAALAEFSHRTGRRIGLERKP
jgi:Tfp pilus assembly protein PilF